VTKTISVVESEALALLRLRHSMHQLNELLKKGAFNIPIHLGFGYEAAAVGMDVTMGPDDLLCLTHRNAAYNLARSKSLDLVLSNYRQEPRSDGMAHMGSMNLTAAGTGIAYSASILGNNLPVAAGIAMNRRLLGRPGIVFAATGDGGLEEGAFWETLIFARSHRLGLVVVVENNDCSMSSSIEQRRCPIDLSLVCQGLGVSYRHASGAVLADVKAVLGAARAEAADGQPALVELSITAFNQHAGPTPGWPGDPMHIALENGWMVGDDGQDPIHALEQALGTEEFERLAARAIGESSRG
jgi:TPP-dependent pyruvate/acetoin dehydrogenase alpha subunit